MTSNLGSEDAGKYPADLMGQLGQGERIQFFSYLATKGGCLGMGGTSSRYWIAMTDRRIIYSAMVQDQNKTINRDGMVPFPKVSHVEVAEVKQGGCMSSKSYLLKIGASGGEVHIPITTREKGLEVRNAYARLAHSGA